MKCRLSARSLALTAFLGATSFSDLALADQFTLMDVNFTFTKEDADNSMPSPSHYYVYSSQLVSGQPSNWTTPVDYRNGTVHIRTEVLDKPAGGFTTQWSLCYIPIKPIGQGYGCTNTGTYEEEGVFEVDESMTEWWENGSIDWTGGIKEMHLVIKDENSGDGHAHKRADSENFFPTTVRITMVQVSAGSTYDESLVPELQDSGSGGSDGTGGADAASGGTATGGAGTDTGGTGDDGTGSPIDDGGEEVLIDDSGEDGGCSYAAAPRTTPSAPLWYALGFLGLGAFAARRRQVVRVRDR